MVTLPPEETAGLDSALDSSKALSMIITCHCHYHGHLQKCKRLDRPGILAQLQLLTLIEVKGAKQALFSGTCLIECG